MKKLLLLLSIVAFVACKNEKTPDRKTYTTLEQARGQNLTREQKMKIKDFLKNRLADVNKKIEQYPDSIILQSMKKFLTEKLEQYQ